MRSSEGLSKGGWPAAGLIAVYVAVIVLPLGLAAMAGLRSRHYLAELSAGVAMAGFALLLLEFALSGRFRAISAVVGMDTVMRFHQAMAWVLPASAPRPSRSLRACPPPDGPGGRAATACAARRRHGRHLRPAGLAPARAPGDAFRAPR
ncbi:MAG: hypothetical protein U5L11_14795 [Arhodomonas sp.]|nr:hypothetical protein [Arhodomonas sp.]